METSYKFGKVGIVCSSVEFGDDKVSFKNLFETENGGVSLIAMKKGQKLDTHTTPFEVMLMVGEGMIEFTMLDKPNRIDAGQFILMGANVAHSIKALVDSKMMLIKVKGPKI